MSLFEPRPVDLDQDERLDHPIADELIRRIQNRHPNTEQEDTE